MSKGDHEYLFDFKLFGSLRVRADNVEEARKKMAEALDAADTNFGAWPETGDPILGDVSVERDADGPVLELMEIDGDELCVTCGGPNGDGEGFDGECGSCADKTFLAEKCDCGCGKTNDECLNAVEKCTQHIDDGRGTCGNLGCGAVIPGSKYG